ALVINPMDNVAVVADSVGAGEAICLMPARTVLTAAGDIPSCHKVSVRPIEKGENIIKYGEVIGCATEDIPGGAHVHEHNMASVLRTGN
ncbi:MAG: UxaA family hydrolase, partial [Candidatus Heteroscillospira sp.]